MTEDQVRMKLQKACKSLFLTRNSASSALLVSAGTLHSDYSLKNPKIGSLLNFADVYALAPEYFFSDMPYEVAVMCPRDQIDEKLAQADVGRVRDRFFSVCQSKGRTMYDFGLRYDRLVRDGNTRFLNMRVRRFFSLLDGLEADPAAVLFGDAYRPLPYPITEEMMDLLDRDVELRKMLYSLVSGGTGRVL